jgi:HD superfamily phosphohydrolase
LQQKGSVGAYKYRAVILDPVHGFIPVNEAEYTLLQTPFMRRLHNITQLGLTYLVYPGARHTRFEHSIGVMHLMGKFSEKLISIMQENSDLCLSITSECKRRELKNFVQLSRLVGLLHDLGHMPFSHQFEIALNNARSDGLIKLEWLEGFNGKIHEYYTSSFIKSLSESLGGRRIKLYHFLQAVNDVLTRHRNPRKEPMDKLGLRPGAFSVVNQLISGTVDADRLDYVLRDSLHTGVVYGRVDIDRLIYALTLDLSNGKPQVMYDIRGLSALEDMFDSRIKMYKWLYLHHKNTSFYIALTRILERIIELWDKIRVIVYPTLPSDISIEEFLEPGKAAELIGTGQILYDEQEFIQAAKALRWLGDPSGSRWASSIMERRDLLPVSIIKRMGDITLYTRDRPQDMLKKLFKFISSPDKVRLIEEKLTREYEAKLGSSLKDRCQLTESKARFTVSSLSIEKRALKRDLKIKGTRILEVSGVSSHIRGIHYSASEPIIYVHAYSEDVCEHLFIRENSSAIKELVVEVLTSLE